MQAVLVLVLSFVAASSALFGRTKSTSNCPVELYDSSDASFTGLKLYGNADTFHPILRTLSRYAKECRVKIQIKQAFVQENAGLTKLKINDRTEMAFRLGEAIEFELLDQDKKVLCNLSCLQKDIATLKVVPDAQCFLRKVLKNSDIRLDAVKPNLLMKRSKGQQSLVQLQDKREEVQKQCNKLKVNQ